MITFTRIFRRFKASICAYSNTNPNSPKPATGSKAFNSNLSKKIEEFADDPNVTFPTESKSNRFRAFEPCKRLVARAKTLKLKFRKTFSRDRTSFKDDVAHDYTESPETATNLADVSTIDCISNIPREFQFFPDEPEEFSPCDFSHEVFYSMRALYLPSIEDAASSKRNLALSLIASNTTIDTSLATIEISRKSLQTLFSDTADAILGSIDSIFAAAEVNANSFDFEGVPVCATDWIHATDSTPDDNKNAEAAMMTTLACTQSEFSVFVFKRLLQLFVVLQEYCPTYSGAEIKTACQGTFVSESLSPVKIDAFKYLKGVRSFDFKLILSRVFPVSCLYVAPPLSRRVPPTEQYVEYVLWNVNSWTIPKDLSASFGFRNGFSDETMNVIEEVDEVEVNVSELEVASLAGIKVETEEVNENEGILDFVNTATKEMPDFRLFYFANMEYQPAEAEFEEIDRISIVEFSDFNQIAVFYNEDAPLALATDSDSEIYELEPLKSCLMRSQFVSSEVDVTSDKPHGVKDELANFEADKAFFNELCDRFISATHVSRCPGDIGDEYWEDLEYFIDISQLTFANLSAGVAEVKIYGLHVYVEKCVRTVKLVAQVFNSYLGMANRYEVMLETYRHANTLWSLDDIRMSVHSERKHLAILRDSLYIVSNSAMDVVREMNEALNYYADESKTCAAAVSTVLLTFDEFLAQTLSKSYPTSSTLELEEMCGKTYFIKAFGEYHRDYFRDAKLLITCNVDDITQGVKVLETLDASIGRALIELSECIWMEMKLTEN